MKTAMHGLTSAALVALSALGPVSQPARAALVVPAAQSTFFSCNGTSTSPPVRKTISGLSSTTGNCVDEVTGGNGKVVLTTKLDAAGDPIARESVTSNAGICDPNVFDCGPLGVGIFPGGKVTLTYYVGLDEVAPPPFIPSSGIPVDFVASIIGSGTGQRVAIDLSSAVTGYSNVPGFGPSISNDVNAFLGSGDVALATLPSPLFFFPNQGPAIAQVSLSVACSVQTFSGGIASGSAECAADPVVGLDQALFDRTFGANSYPLANYFAFVYSDGLAPQGPAEPRSGVPEPASIALVVIALPALVIGRRKKRPSFSPPALAV